VSPYVRTVKTSSGVTAVQIVYSSRRGSREIDHLGSAHSDAESVSSKVEQLRKAQEVGQLDPAWDPLDILVFVNQMAMSWAAQPDLAPTADEERAPFMAARRAVIVAAVRLLFPSAVGGTADGAH